MTVKVDFFPQETEALLIGSVDVYAVINFTVFPEYESQHKMKDYPSNDVRKLDAIEYDSGYGLNFFYVGRFDYS